MSYLFSVGSQTLGIRFGNQSSSTIVSLQELSPHINGNFSQIKEKHNFCPSTVLIKENYYYSIHYKKKVNFLSVLWPEKAFL